MKKFLTSAIDACLEWDKLRFHTPGHKGLLGERDITEFDDGFPGEAISKSQEAVASLMGCKNIRYSVGGSSMCIKAAVLAAGGDILIARNSHRALFEAASLAGVNAFTIENEVKDGLPLPLSAEQVERGLKEHPSVKAVYITSPDYYGLTARGEIAEAVRGRAYLFCDAAHGAHFPFRPDLFPRSYSDFADAANLSAHKTLPAYTQTAYLAVNNEGLLDKIDKAFALLGTTSPSYVLLEGLEHAALYAYEHRAQYDALEKSVEDLAKSVPVLKNNDFTRIVVDAEAMGLSGKELYLKLKSKGIVAEKYDGRYTVFIVTVADDPQTIKLLKESICEVGL